MQVYDSTQTRFGCYVDLGGTRIAVVTLLWHFLVTMTKHLSMMQKTKVIAGRCNSSFRHCCSHCWCLDLRSRFWRHAKTIRPWWPIDWLMLFQPYCLWINSMLFIITVKFCGKIITIFFIKFGVLLIYFKEKRIFLLSKLVLFLGYYKSNLISDQ